MFPRPDRPARPAHAWLDAVRHGLDLIVAFATLRDAEAPPEADETTPAAGISRPHADTIPPATAAGRRRAAERAGQPARAEQSARQSAADRANASAPRRAADRANESAPRRAADRANESDPQRADRSAQRPSDRSQRRAAEGAEPPASHPHRRPLHRASRLRRPGAVRPEPQACLTPIVARRARPTRAPARGARH